jgi:hypothetical protein
LKVEVTPLQRRNLILISKILQSIANGVLFGEKEGYMKITNQYISSTLPTIDNFLEVISVRSSGNYSTYQLKTMPDVNAPALLPGLTNLVLASNLSKWFSLLKKNCK